MTYHDTYEWRTVGRGRCELFCTHSWADFTHARMTWLYGQERADLIRAGLDPRTEQDRAAWDRMGGQMYDSCPLTPSARTERG